MFDYPHLEVLLAVEREGSLDRAALTKGVTKSAISQTLKLLEERMGAVTLNRNSTETTHLGAKLCRHMEHVNLLEQRFLIENAHLLGKIELPSVTVKIAIDDDSLSSWFTDVVKGTHAIHDRVLLDIVMAKGDETFREMQDGKISAAISTRDTPLPNFTTYTLGRHIYYATATPEFVSRYFANGVTIDALKQAPSVRYGRQRDHSDQWIERAFDANEIISSDTVASSHGIANACIDGAAWGMNPSLLVKDYLDRGELVELIPGVTIAQNIYWHVSSIGNETLAPVTRNVRDAAQSHLPEAT